jgi:homoserine dehydrogenase
MSGHLKPAGAERAASARRVAILGCGTVGREVASRLIEFGERLGLQLVKVLVRDVTRDRGLPRELFTASVDEIESARPDVVVELIGGVEPAGSLVERFLSRGVSCVTANKTLIAHRGPELRALAERSGAELAFEASVCGAIPVIATLRHLEGDRVLSIKGVVNGSCNFILSRLGEGWKFEDALAEARKRGLVEPDPSADISGRDSAEKLCVLAAAAGVSLLPSQVETRGIESLTPEDLAAARRSGQTIKLIAELDLSGGAARARVGPTLLPRLHPLAQAVEEENAVAIETVLAGEIFLRGRGAGPRPTASAVLGDVVRLAGRARTTAASVTGAVAGEGWPARPHALRFAGRVSDPGVLLRALESSGVEPEEIVLSREGGRILTGPVEPGIAAACAGALPGGVKGASGAHRRAFFRSAVGAVRGIATQRMWLWEVESQSGMP